MCACLWGWSGPVIYNSLQAALIYVGASAQLVQTEFKGCPEQLCRRGGRWPGPGQHLAPSTRHTRIHPWLSCTKRAGGQLTALTGYQMVIPPPPGAWQAQLCITSL